MTDKSISNLKDIKDGYGFYCHVLKDWSGGTICALNIKDPSGQFLFSLHFNQEQQIVLFWEHLWKQFDSIPKLDYAHLVEALAESAIQTQSGHIRDDTLNVLAHFT